MREFEKSVSKWEDAAVDDERNRVTELPPAENVVRFCHAHANARLTGLQLTDLV